MKYCENMTLGLKLLEALTLRQGVGGRMKLLFQGVLGGCFATSLPCL
jgi:hypothetical protein